jgi:tRNA 2-thiouridine synthesizing protein A
VIPDPVQGDPAGSEDPLAEGAIGRTVDARGLSCPMPVLELAKAIDQIEVGQRVHLLATDPAAKVDVPVWCRMQRQRLHRQERDEQVWHFEVERTR